nr:hypothetical protein [Tanacetum cinerariifolium]
MSDSEDSTVTYTTVSSLYVVRSGDVSPGEDGPSVMSKDPYAYVVAAFQALPASDYVPGLEEPEQAPPSPVYMPYVPEPVSPGEDAPQVMPEDPYAYVVAAFQALPPPDYVPSLEEPEQAPPSPVYIPYVPELEYPEYIPPEDEVFPAEEQPLPTVASPTTDSPGYIP